MVVTFNQDLSEKATSILTNHPEQMQIDYQTSWEAFIASKMSDSAMTQLNKPSLRMLLKRALRLLFQKK